MFVVKKARRASEKPDGKFRSARRTWDFRQITVGPRPQQNVPTAIIKLDIIRPFPFPKKKNTRLYTVRVRVGGEYSSWARLIMKYTDNNRTAAKTRGKMRSTKTAITRRKQRQ